MTNLSFDYLDKLKPSYLEQGFPVPKWIQFSETLLQNGWSVSLHRAKTTVSKYLHISKGGKKYKIRFSNHKANKYKEKSGDCDYYVGRGNLGIITTEQLLETLLKRKS